uniref:Transmembrane protein 198 n=1 Tax=Globisporangium ultimum (strain ATCC 200006 / CBS 805.95 / DAOM BR144) TaxID=431595 RepID=K3WC70_GLOUD
MSWTCFFLGGILLCLMVLWNDTFARFVIGLTAGLLLGFGCNTTFGFRIHPDHPEMTLVTLLVVLGAMSGFLTVKKPYWSIIISTSWIGANTMAWGLGYFVGQYPNGASLSKFRDPESHHYAIPSAWWGYLAGTVVCFLLGTLLQHYANDNYHFSHARGDHY